MPRVALTGAYGFLGFHLRARCVAESDMELVLLGREDFAEVDLLADRLSRVEAVVHFAGVNRGTPEEVHAGNIEIAERLCEGLVRAGGSPHVVYASTTHTEGDTPYGRSKLRAGKILGEWANSASATLCQLVLPHVFGEFGRPFYNSGVATFCHQLATGGEPEIHHDGQLELVHAHDVAAVVLDSLEEREDAVRRVPGMAIKVSEVLELLRSFKTDYDTYRVPDISDDFRRQLFNTYRSYLPRASFPVAVELHSDARGELFETLKSRSGGQAFFSWTRPGVRRGEHFHFRKFERFLVIQGQASIRLRRLFDEEIIEYEVGGESPGFVDIPTFHTHDLTNTGESDLLTAFWSHEWFDPEDPDTFAEAVGP